MIISLDQMSMCSHKVVSHHDHPTDSAVVLSCHQGHFLMHVVVFIKKQVLIKILHTICPTSKDCDWVVTCKIKNLFRVILLLL